MSDEKKTTPKAIKVLKKKDTLIRRGKFLCSFFYNFIMLDFCSIDTNNEIYVLYIA